MPDAIELHEYDDYITTHRCKWEGRVFQFEVKERVYCLANKQIESSLMPHNLSMQVMEIMDEVRKQIKFPEMNTNLTFGSKEKNLLFSPPLYLYIILK